MKKLTKIILPISDLVLKLKLLLIYIIKMFVILNKIKFPIYYHIWNEPNANIWRANLTGANYTNFYNK